jgi:hypothetical protein
MTAYKESPDSGGVVIITIAGRTGDYCRGLTPADEAGRFRPLF